MKLLLKETERYVLDCTFELSVQPQDAGVQIPLDESLSSLKKLYDDGNAIYTLYGGRIKIRIQDWIEDKDRLTLLFHYSDKDASDPSFSNHETGATRTIKKKRNEGLSSSAHLVLNKNAHDENFPSLFLCVLEEVPGLTKRAISHALNSFFHAASDFTFKKEGSKKEYKVRPYVSIDINTSSNLNDALSSGFVTGFVGVKRSVESKMDEYSGLHIAEERIVLRSDKLGGDKGAEIIRKAKSLLGKKQYSKMAVKYVDKNKRTTSFEIGTATDAKSDIVTNNVFSRPVRIPLSDNINQCEEEVHNELNSKMLYQLNKNIEKCS